MNAEERVEVHRFFEKVDEYCEMFVKYENCIKARRSGGPS